MVNPNSRVFVIVGVIIIITVIVLVTLVLLRSESSTTPTSDTQTLCTLLPFPQNIQGAAQGISKIRLIWDSVTGAARYRIFVGTVPGFTTANALTTELANVNQITIGGLISGRDYFIRIETLNQCNLPGQLSPEVKITLGFPSEFVIANKINPDIVFGTFNGSTSIVTLETNCVGDDEYCYWIHNNVDKTIRPKFDTTRCLISRDDGMNPDEIGIDLCIAITQDKKQWEFDEDLGSLCHPQPTGGFACIKTDTIGPGQSMYINNFDGTNTMQWDIIGI